MTHDPSAVTIYHNPRCSKSRQTLELLRERGIEPTIIEYMKDPPSPQRVEELIAALGMAPHALLRSKEAPYRELGLTPEVTAAQVAAAVAAHPVLLERPVVVVGDRAALGRPPHNVLTILG